MSASLGDLVVSLSANIAKFEAAMTRAEYLAQKSMSSVNNSANLAKNAMTALGVGVSFAGLVAFAKHTIDTADNMGKLAQKLGTTTTELSKMKYVAEQNDISLDTISKGAKALAEHMAAAGDKTSKSAKLMKELGVDLNAGLLPNIEKIAETFEALPDGPTKTALAVEVFKKAGMDMIPMLNQGSSGMRALADEAARAGFIISEDAAKAAADFSDNLKTVKTSAEFAGQAIFNELAPSMTRISKAMAEAAKEGGVLSAIWVGLGGLASEALGLNDDEVQKLRTLRKEMEHFKEMQANGVPLMPGEELRLKHLKEEIRVLEELVKKNEEAAKARKKADDSAKGSKENKDKEDRLKRLLADAKTQGLDPFTQSIQKLVAELEGKAIGVTVDYAQKIGQLQVAMVTGMISVGDYTRLFLELTKQQDFYKQRVELVAKAEEVAAEQRRQHINDWLAHDAAQQQTAVTVFENLEVMRLEFNAIGKTNVEREVMLLNLQKERDLRGVTSQAIRDNIEANYAEMEQIIRNTEARARQFKEIEDGWTRAADLGAQFTNVLFKQGDVVDFVKDQVKSLIAELIALTAKKWILQLGANLTGSSVLGNAAQGVGTNMLGTAASWAGSAISGTSIGGTMIGSFADVAAGFSGATQGISLAAMEGATWATTVGSAVGSIYSSITSVLAAMGPVGWIVAGAAAIAAILHGRRGGDKVGGSFMGAFDADGNFTGDVSVPGSDNGRFFTPSGEDTAIRNMMMEQGKGYARIAKSLGATAIQSFAFGLGFDHDPEGDAMSRVSSMVTDAQGNVVYSNLDREMDDKDVPKETALEMKRQLIAALQATDLHDALDEMLDSVTNLATMSAEEIDALLTELLETGGVLRGLADVNLTNFDLDALKAFALEGETIGQTFQRVVGQFKQVEDAFTSDATKLKIAGDKVTALFQGMGKEMPKTREGYLDLMRGLDLSTEAGRTLFQQMMDLAPAFDAVTAATEAAMGEFDQLMGRLRPGYTGQRAQMQLGTDVSSFMAANGWTTGMTPQQVIDALGTITREDFGRYSTANQRLILSILTLNDSVGDAASAIGESAESIESVAVNFGSNSPIAQGAAAAPGMYAQLTGNWSDIIGSGNTLAERMTRQRDITEDQIWANARRMGELWNANGGTLSGMPAEFHMLAELNRLLQEDFNRLGPALQELAALTAEYGDEVGTQLFELEGWYEAQQALLAGNLDALAFLEAEYAERRQAILEGEGEIIDEVAEAIERAKQGLKGWIDSMLIGNLSPLTLEQQLEAARQQYEATRALAAGGDVDAMNELQGVAQQYLELARQLYASSPDYNAIFREVLQEVGAVAGVSQGEINAKLNQALPANSTIASRADMMEVKLEVATLVTLISQGISVTDPQAASTLAEIREALNRMREQGVLA
jgi:DNA-binding phage protein